MPEKREIVVSGMRPTGRLHLGNYWGALKNWIELPGRHDCYFFVADWHMLTTGYEDTSKLKDNSREMVLDWLAAGLSPEKCVLFKQSDVPEHAELALMLGMVTPLPWLINSPSYKETIKELFKDRMNKILNDEGQKGHVDQKTAEVIEEAVDSTVRTQGLLGYPLLQTADIMLYHGTLVPVGQDQIPHIELSREITRRFNKIFGKIFPEPQALLTPTPRVPGLDGRKMSKSYDNALNLFEDEKSLKTKIGSMYTDPTRIKATDPGHPEPCAENPPGCSVFALHKLYAGGAFVAKRGEECRAGKIGCVACKKDLLSEMEPAYARFRQAREGFSAKPGLVEDILAGGAQKARAIAQKTMAEARRAMRVS